MPLKRPVPSGLVGLVAGFSILALLGVITLHSESARRDSGEWVRHTIEVQGDINELYARLLAAESGQRGFVITADESYLAPYVFAAGAIDREIAEFARFVADNPYQTMRITQLRPLIQERLAIIKSAIDAKRAGEDDVAIAIVKAGRGKEIMGQVNAIIDEMRNSENALLLQRQQVLSETTQTLDAALALTVLLGVAVAAFAILHARQQMNQVLDASFALKAANEELLNEAARRESLEAQLRQSQKLEAIGQLTGGIAHDFNNMLGVIVSSLNLLKRKLARGDRDYEQFIQSAMDGAENAAALTHRLLAFARRQPLAPTPLDANIFIADIKGLLRHTVGDRVKLDTALADGLWLTEVDAQELTSVIVNLAVNARDAMPDGGRVTIETQNCTLDDAYAAQNGAVKAGAYVMLAVSDTGSGMSADVLAKVFEPFFTTKPVGKGTGLGLAQVYGFVSQTGGHVKIYSELGVGTTIKIYLPRYTGGGASPLVSSAAPGADLPRARQDEIVLIVEDDPRARELTSQSVTELGYTVLLAAAAGAALKILDERADVTLLLTDMVMPEMNGIALADAAQSQRPDLKVLFMTGYTPKSAASNGLLVPQSRILAKPFTLEQVARKLRDVLDE
jgi:signal transduction histidine kinase